MSSSFRGALAMMPVLMAVTLAPLASAPAIALEAPSPKLQRAIAVAKLMYPESINMRAGRQMLAGVPREIAADPASADVERAYPGILKAISSAIQARMEEQMRASLPSVWVRIGGVYVTTLTDAELTQMLAFLPSEDGKFYIEQRFANSNTAALIDQIEKHKSFGTVELSQINAAATKKLVDHMTPAGRERTVAISQKINLRKLTNLDVHMTQVMFDWAKTLQAEIGAELKGVVFTTMRDYIASHPRAEKVQ